MVLKQRFRQQNLPVCLKLFLQNWHFGFSFDFRRVTAAFTVQFHRFGRVTSSVE